MKFIISVSLFLTFLISSEGEEILTQNAQQLMDAVVNASENRNRKYFNIFFGDFYTTHMCGRADKASDLYEARFYKSKTERIVVSNVKREGNWLTFNASNGINFVIQTGADKYGKFVYGYHPEKCR